MRVTLLAQGLAHGAQIIAIILRGMFKSFSPLWAGQGKGWDVRMQL